MTNEEGEPIVFWGVVVTAENGDSFTSLDLCEDHLLAGRFCGEVMAEEVDFLHIPELLDDFLAEIYGMRP